MSMVLEHAGRHYQRTRLRQRQWEPSRLQSKLWGNGERRRGTEEGNGGGERRRGTGRKESEVKKRKSTSEKVRYAIGT